MGHTFGFWSGRLSGLTSLESWLLNRVHETGPPNHLGIGIQPNIRRVRFFSFTVPKKNNKEFIEDLSPFNHGSGFMKNRLKDLTKLMRSSFGLKESAVSIGKRKVENPRWRDFINVFMIGFKNLEGGKLRKYFVAMECQRKYSDLYIEWLSKREYFTGLPNRPGMVVGSYIAEIRLFDMSVKESCHGQLLRDLSPFSVPEESFHPLIRWGFKLGRKLLGLTDPPAAKDKAEVEFPFPRDWVSVYLLAEKPDVMLPDPDERGVMAEMV